MQDVEALFRASEYRPTTFRSQQDGHAFSQHIGIPNEAMLQRYAERYRNSRNNSLVAITAFVENHEAFRAGMETLNSPVGQQALQALDNWPTGTRVQISHAVTTPTRIRYVLAGQVVRIIPDWRWFRLIIDRNEVLPYGIHCQTFFAFMSENPRDCWQRQG